MCIVRQSVWVRVDDICECIERCVHTHIVTVLMSTHAVNNKVVAALLLHSDVGPALVFSFVVEVVLLCLLS